MLKIDNENGSRGVATLDIAKILGKKMLSKIGEENKNQEKTYREDIYSLL